MMRSGFAGLTRRLSGSAGLLGGFLLMLPVLMLPAVSQGKLPEDKIKIGILQDVAPPATGETGNGAIAAAQMAASDFGTEFLKGDAEILPGTTDGSTQATRDQVRDWLDNQHVAAVLSSAGPLVDRQIARMVAQRHRTLLVASADADPDAALCSPDAIIWGTGPAARARALAQALAPRAVKRWLVLADRTPTSIAGQAALHDAVATTGGQIIDVINDVGSSVALAKAQPKIEAADPQIVVLTEGDGDLVEVIRAARTASLTDRATFAAPHARIADIDQAGVTMAAGLVVVAPFYWDTDAATRDFSRRWNQHMPGSPADDNAAEVYAATLSFLHAAKAVEDISADKVRVELGRAPIRGTLFGTVSVRTDGRVMHDLNVYRVKQPAAIQARWAYYTRLATVPAAAAFPPLSCPKQ